MVPVNSTEASERDFEALLRRREEKMALKAHVTLLQTTRKKALSLTEAAARALAPGRAMEGQAGTASAPAPPRRSTRCHCVMRSGFSLSYEDEGGGAR